jgi:coenzyme Q-binding protein COQ10
MSHARAAIDIHAPLETVYDVICDFESYPEFLPETKRVHVDKNSGKSALVTFTISLIKKVTYTLDVKFHPHKGISWHLVKGELMKENSGQWKLSEPKHGVTHASYEISMDFGGMVPKAISNKLIGSNLPAMMKQFRDRAQEMA